MFINVKIEERDNTFWCLTTGMHVEFKWENKHLTWSRMRQLHQNQNLPWLRIGDYNEIQFLHEKGGGNPKPIQYMQAFQNEMDDCELQDLDFVGGGRGVSHGTKPELRNDWTDVS